MVLSQVMKRGVLSQVIILVVEDNMRSSMRSTVGDRDRTRAVRHRQLWGWSEGWGLGWATVKIRIRPPSENVGVGVGQGLGLGLGLGSGLGLLAGLRQFNSDRLDKDNNRPPD